MTVEENSIDRDSTTSVGGAHHLRRGELATGTWESTSGPRRKFPLPMPALPAGKRPRGSVERSFERSESDYGFGRHRERSGGTSILRSANGSASCCRQRASHQEQRAGSAEPGRTPNLQPLIESDPKHAQVHFGLAVPEATSYDMRISTNSMFTRVIAEKTVSGTAVDITGLDPGDYFWTVTIDKSKRESAPAEAYKFTLVGQGKGQEMLLELDSTALHGNMVELVGHSEPGAALIRSARRWLTSIRVDGSDTLRRH